MGHPHTRSAVRCFAAALALAAPSPALAQAMASDPAPAPPPVAFYREVPDEAADLRVYFSARPASELPNWHREELAFYAFREQQPGTVPVYCESPRDHSHAEYRFRIETEAAAHAAGWEQLYVAFYAYPGARPGTTPVYEAVRVAPPRDHLVLALTTRPTDDPAHPEWRTMPVDPVFFAPLPPSSERGDCVGCGDAGTPGHDAVRAASGPQRVRARGADHVERAPPRPRDRPGRAGVPRVPR